ncbi:MAG: hypothetical protein LW878_01775 [Proteobacteria bacterium]|nr:hypothetical protein [Pseudomonadota bacterium]
MMKLSETKANLNLDSFTIGHFFEELSFDDSFYLKKFFRGLSIYVHGKAVAYIANRPGDKSFREKNYQIDIWNGCLIPTEREHHTELLKLIKGTVIHPVIQKWLYLPHKSEHFEESIFKIVDLIKKQSELVGIVTTIKLKKKGSVKKSKKKIKKRST